MKTFISRYSNYLLVLRAGKPAVPAIGQPSIKGLSIRFDGDSLARVEDEETIEMILASDAFRRKDIVLAENEEKPEDPYKNRRTQMEPEHNILVMERGAIAKNVNPRGKVIFTPEQKEVINGMVSNMAKEMAKEMLKNIAGKIVEEKKDKKNDEENPPEQKNKVVVDIVQNETKKKLGRPPKNTEDKIE